MALFQGGTGAYWFWITTAVSALMALCIWSVVLVGREFRAGKPKGYISGKQLGGVSDEPASFPTFIKITIAGVILWGLGYLIWTGINGVTGF